MVKVFRSLLVLFILTLFACGDRSFLMTLSDSENAVRIKTSVLSGDILDPDSGEAIDISLDYDETVVVPDSLEIAFLDDQGLEISKPQIIEGDALNKPLPSLSITSPDEGLYSVRIRAFDIEKTLLKEEIVSFFYFNEPLSIKGLSAYPSVFTTSGQGLIFPDVEGPDSSWVRWSMDNEIIEEGFLSQYRDGFVWQAPLQEGVYGLKMELFPFEPKGTINGTFPFTSPIRSDIEIFVTSKGSIDPGSLYPSASYSTLIHFNGIVEDQGTHPSKISIIGSPKVQRKGDRLGFYLGKGSGYKINRNILPVLDGKILPFSVTFSYFLFNSLKDAGFLDISSNGESLFSIKTDENGILVGELYQSGLNIKDSSGISPENYNEITLSLVPVSDRINFLWYADGILLSSNEFKYRSGILDGNYISIIGADNSFEGLLDEFGIYNKDKAGNDDIDDNIFLRRINRKYNLDKIIKAYGFDGLYFSDDNNPSLNVNMGSLYLEPESVFQFLNSDSDFSHLYIEINFDKISDDTSFEIIFKDQDLDKNIYINISDILGPAGSINEIEIDVNMSEGILSLLSGGEVIYKKNVKFYSQLDYKILNSSKDSITKISSLSVRREEKKVVSNKTNILETEL